MSDQRQLTIELQAARNALALVKDDGHSQGDEANCLSCQAVAAFEELFGPVSRQDAPADQ